MRHHRRHLLITGLAALAFCTTAALAQFRSTNPLGSVDAVAYSITDSASGFVLASNNATKKLQIASITKIATAIVVIDWASAKGEDLGQLATVPQSPADLSSPNSIGLQPGDTMSLRDLLYTALMQSDNTAADTLAVHVGRKLGGGPDDAAARDFFVAQMNALGRKIGMKSTRFLNPHGLDDLEDKLPHSTAADVAVLTNYALSRSGFLFYVSQKTRKISWQRGAGEAATIELKTTNEILGMDSIDGVKTGRTSLARSCLVISAAQPPESKPDGDKHIITPRRLTVVVLNSGTRFDTARALLASGWKLLDQWAAAGRPMKGWKPSSIRP